MSLYPLDEPGVYAQTRIAEVPGLDTPDDRRHANHGFTAVSVPFATEEQFAERQRMPGVYDDFGYPLGQQERRDQLLKAAAVISLEDSPLITRNSQMIPVVATVRNVGVGHRFPSGFSQERQVWIELIVRDEAGVLYQSGVLEDKAHPETGEMEPDGLLDDEDLEGHSFNFARLEDAAGSTRSGPNLAMTELNRTPDENFRPEGINLGLVNLQNEFVQFRRTDPNNAMSPFIESEEAEFGFAEDRRLLPLGVNHMDNTHSIEPFVPKVYRYDIPVTREIMGDVTITARLRYRAFPPEFMRALAVLSPTIVTEAMVDQNTIIEVDSDAKVILGGDQQLEGGNVVGCQVSSLGSVQSGLSSLGLVGLLGVALRLRRRKSQA